MFIITIRKIKSYLPHRVRVVATYNTLSINCRQECKHIAFVYRVQQYSYLFIFKSELKLV